MPRPFTERERRNVRAALLEAARVALPRTGMRRTAVEDLTRAAGISKGAFYQFFESKEALWVALLGEAEGRARAAIGAILDDPPEDPVRRVLEVLFSGVWADPVLRALTDAEDLAWLARGLPPGAMDAARADDEAFFAGVHAALRASGALRDDVPAEVFCGIPAAALALAQQRTAIGEDRFDALTGLLIDGLALRLGVTSARVTTSTDGGT